MELVAAGQSRFSVGGVNFVVDIGFGDGRRRSDNEAFTLVKSHHFVNYYHRLSQRFRPRTLLELGIFEGGGYVLLDKLFDPAAMSAIDQAPGPVAPLARWIEGRARRSAHFGTDQADPECLRRIAAEEFGGVLDMVVDDASHQYEQCRKSFEILFPLLSPGGYYVIEDWSWSHEPRYQGADAPFAARPALTNLIFDIVMLTGSTRFIAELHVERLFAVVRKSVEPIDVPADLWSAILTRDRQPAPI